MTNPVFNPAVWAAQTAFTVSETSYVAADIALIGIDANVANIALTLPAGATLKAYRTPATWTGAGGVTLLTGGVWTNAAVLGDWNLSVTPGPAPTDEASLSVISATSGAGGRLRLVATGLSGPASLAPGLADAIVIDRILAAPRIAFLSSNPPPPISEHSPVTISATVSHSEVVNPAPILPLAAKPTLLSQWATDPANTVAVPGAFALGTSASFLAPAIYQDTTLSFTLAAVLDLNGNGSVDAGDPATTAKDSYAFQTTNYAMILVLDRSGSMTGTLGGGMSKWEASVRAAHAWSDLFRAFRPGPNHVAGVVTFENNGGNWNAAGNVIEFRNPSNHLVHGVPILEDLQTFGAIAHWDLDTPKTATPIGDGLAKAWSVLSAQNPLPGRAAVVLMTDGYENSGAVTIASTLAGGGSAKFSDVRKDFAHKPADDVIGNGLYTLAMGTTVDDDRLNALGNKPAYYQQITQKVTEVTSAFAGMLGNFVSAEEMTGGAPNTPDPEAPAAGTALYYPVSGGEQVLAFLVQWNSSNDRLRVAWRPFGSTGPFSLVAPAAMPAPNTPLPPAVEVNRTTHGLIRISLPAVVGAGAPQSEWRLQHVSGNPLAPKPILATEALAMVDLLTSAEVGFDTNEHFVGDTVGLVVKIASGGSPVLGAHVEYDVARPGESLGSYLTQNAKGYIPPNEDKRASAADPANGKGLMVQTLFQDQKIENLGFVTVNGTPMFDDGAHDDGASNDGTYGAFYSDTATEGTYTFRFRMKGTLDDGSVFTRIFTRSIWLGIRPDPDGLFPSWKITNTEGYIQAVLTITPQAKGGQYLGPFRGDVLGVQVSGADLADPSGVFTDLHNGSYQLGILYKPGAVPVVDISIYGQKMNPTGPVAFHPSGIGGDPGRDPGCDGNGTSCGSLWCRAIQCTWRAILRLFRRLTGTGN